MLKLFDTAHNALKPLMSYWGLTIEQKINQEDTLTFSISKDDESAERIKEEYYIRTKDNEFIIKELSHNADTINVVAKQNVEDLKKTVVESFENIEDTATAALEKVLAYCPGWKMKPCDINTKLNLQLYKTTVWDIIKGIADAYSGEIAVDTINKKIQICKHIGEDKGYYFIENLNLRELSYSTDTYDLVTRLYPLGADGVTIEPANNGVPYIENFQYTDKIIEGYWTDERYTLPEHLLSVAIEKLDSLSKPLISYEVKVIDLAAVSGLAPESYAIGDIVTLISKSNKIKEKQRIVSLKRFPDSPEDNSCTLTNEPVSLTNYMAQNFSQYKDLKGYTSRIAQKVDSIELSVDTPNGTASITIGDKTIKDIVNKDGVEQAVDKAVAAIDLNGYVTFTSLSGSGTTTINAGNITTGTLDCSNIDVSNLSANSIKTGTLDCSHINIDNLSANSISAGKVSADYIGSLPASQITSGVFSTDRIPSLSADKITSGTIDASKIDVKNLNASNITSGSLSADRISGGSIDASKIEVKNLAIDDVTYGGYPVITCSGSTTAPTIAIGKSQSSNTYRATELDLYAKDIQIGDSCSTGRTLSIDTGTLNIDAYSGIKFHVNASTSSSAFALTTNNEFRPDNTSLTSNLGSSTYYWSNAYIGSTAAYIGKTTSSKIGFFGTTPIARQTLSTSSNNMGYTSATANNYLYVLNNVVGIMKKYGLIG